jgi:hypothetical protein
MSTIDYFESQLQCYTTASIFDESNFSRWLYRNLLLGNRIFPVKRTFFCSGFCMVRYGTVRLKFGS